MKRVNAPLPSPTSNAQSHEERDRDEDGDEDAIRLSDFGEPGMLSDSDDEEVCFFSAENETNSRENSQNGVMIGNLYDGDNNDGSVIVEDAAIPVGDGSRRGPPKWTLNEDDISRICRTAPQKSTEGQPQAQAEAESQAQAEAQDQAEAQAEAQPQDQAQPQAKTKSHAQAQATAASCNNATQATARDRRGYFQCVGFA